MKKNKGVSKFEKYGQYRKDVFEKLNFPFKVGKSLLEVGCGDGADSEIFIKEYRLKVTGIDIYKNDNVERIDNLDFSIASIYKLPFKDNTFDYVFLQDVLHHIDEENQSYERHTKALLELKRVCRKGGSIIIVEANRFNPLFYPHMVMMLGHNHWRQSYFKRILVNVFGDVTFQYFEAHSYPSRCICFWKLYEKIMERVSPKMFLAYNVTIAKM